jgi:hypothetical protein
MNVFGSKLAAFRKVFGRQNPSLSGQISMGSAEPLQVPDPDDDLPVFNRQLKELWRALEKRGLDCKILGHRGLGEALHVRIDDRSTSTCVYGAIFEDSAGDPDILLRTCSNDSASYLVPLMTAIGDASDEINTKRARSAWLAMQDTNNTEQTEEGPNLQGTNVVESRDETNERVLEEPQGNTEGSIQHRTFIIEVDEFWVTSRAEWDCVIIGHHASATILGESKPHSIFLSTESDELGYDIPYDPHGLGYHLGDENRTVIKVDEPTISLVRPGAQFEITLRWSTRDDFFYSFFTLVQMKLVRLHNG